MIAGAVVRRVVQAFVGVDQCLFFGEQRKPSTPTCDLRAELAIVSGLRHRPQTHALPTLHVQDVGGAELHARGSVVPRIVRPAQPLCNNSVQQCSGQPVFPCVPEADGPDNVFAGIDGEPHPHQ